MLADAQSDTSALCREAGKFEKYSNPVIQQAD
jgi:hypothetical protein